jgi:hypothetical protein
MKVYALESRMNTHTEINIIICEHINASKSHLSSSRGVSEVANAARTDFEEGSHVMMYGVFGRRVLSKSLQLNSPSKHSSDSRTPN